MSTQEEMAALLSAVTLDVTSLLAAHGVRLHPTIIEMLRAKLEHRLRAALLIGRWNASGPPPPPLAEDVGPHDEREVTRDTRPGFRSRFPPAPSPIGDAAPPPLPPRRR